MAQKAAETNQNIIKIQWYLWLDLYINIHLIYNNLR